MPKCEYCGKEVLFPFVCSYCGKTFCPEHRLPENHQCSNMPKEPFWYQKKTFADEQALRDAMHGYEVCPKCHSPDVGVWSFNKEKVNYECNICHYKWTQPRNNISHLKGKILKDLEEETKQEPKKPKKKRWFFL